MASLPKLLRSEGAYWPGAVSLSLEILTPFLLSSYPRMRAEGDLSFVKEILGSYTPGPI